MEPVPMLSAETLRQENMKPQPFLSIAASVVLLATPLFGGSRPHYGGTLHVLSRDAITSIDGVRTSPNSVLCQQLSYLLFDHLTSVDDFGKANPSLALSWSSDS